MIVALFSVFGRRSRYFAKRIEAFELKTAVIAQQFVQTSHLKNDSGIVVATLDT